MAELRPSERSFRLFGLATVVFVLIVVSCPSCKGGPERAPRTPVTGVDTPPR